MGKPTVRYDTRRVVADMAGRGWLAQDLARVAGLSNMTVSRFLRHQRPTATTVKKIADALGFSARRYVIQPRLRVRREEPTNREAVV